MAMVARARVGVPAQQLVTQLRAQGGRGTLGELGALRAAHTLADALRELRPLGMIEVRDGNERLVRVDGVALALKSARRTAVADYSVTLLPGASA